MTCIIERIASNLASGDNKLRHMQQASKNDPLDESAGRHTNALDSVFHPMQPHAALKVLKQYVAQFLSKLRKVGKQSVIDAGHPKEIAQGGRRHVLCKLQSTPH